MKHLRDAASDHLRWTQTRLFDSNYELTDGSDVYVRLSFPRMFGTLAEAQTADGTFPFKRTGFWHTRVTVRADGSDDNLAVFEHATWSGGGTLTLANGRRIQITTNFWNSRIEGQFDGGPQLFRYDTEGFMRLGATLELSPAATHFQKSRGFSPWAGISSS